MTQDSPREVTPDFYTTGQPATQTLTAEVDVSTESINAFLYGDAQFLDSCMNNPSHIFAGADLDWLLQRSQNSWLSQQPPWNEPLPPHGSH